MAEKKEKTTCRQRGKRLTPDEIVKIKVMFSDGMSRQKIAEKVGSTWHTINDVVTANKPELDDMIRKKNMRYADDFMELANEAVQLAHKRVQMANLSVDEVMTKLKPFVDVFKEACPDAPPREFRTLLENLSGMFEIPVSHLNQLIGTMYDKNALAHGMATGRNEVTGKNGGAIEIAAIDLNDADADALLQRVLERRKNAKEVRSDLT